MPAYRGKERTDPWKKRCWSPTNRRRAEALLAEGKIHQSGLARIDEARANGNWDKALEEKAKPAAPETPEELLSALAGSEAAREFFDQLSPSRRQQMVGWVGVARKPETRHRRAAEAVALLSRKKWLGMK